MPPIPNVTVHVYRGTRDRPAGPDLIVEGHLRPSRRPLAETSEDELSDRQRWTHVLEYSIRAFKVQSRLSGVSGTGNAPVDGWPEYSGGDRLFVPDDSAWFDVLFAERDRDNPNYYRLYLLLKKRVDDPTLGTEPDDSYYGGDGCLHYAPLLSVSVAGFATNPGLPCAPLSGYETFNRTWYFAPHWTDWLDGSGCFVDDLKHPGDDEIVAFATTALAPSARLQRLDFAGLAGVTALTFGGGCGSLTNDVQYRSTEYPHLNPARFYYAAGAANALSYPRVLQLGRHTATRCPLPSNTSPCPDRTVFAVGTDGIAIGTGDVVCRFATVAYPSGANEWTGYFWNRVDPLDNCNLPAVHQKRRIVLTWTGQKWEAKLYSALVAGTLYLVAEAPSLDCTGCSETVFTATFVYPSSGLLGNAIEVL